jgi:hypothetical protein
MKSNWSERRKVVLPLAPGVAWGEGSSLNRRSQLQGATVSVTYLDILIANQKTYGRTHWLPFVPWYYPLKTADEFKAIHKTAIQALARQDQVDWTQTYTAIDGPTLIATVIAAVIAVVCPATAPAEPLIESVVAVIVKILLSSLQTSFASGAFGASPADFSAQVQAWAQEAAA